MLLEKARRESDAAATAKAKVAAERDALQEAAIANRREESQLAATRARFEEEAEERIRSLDAREERVARAEGLAARLQQQERALHVRLVPQLLCMVAVITCLWKIHPD